MAEHAKLVISVDSTQAKQADAALDKLGRTSSAVERNVGSLTGALTRIAGPLAAFVSVRAVVAAADQYGQMASRMKMATSSAVEYAAVQERLIDTANRTYRPLAEAQELYIRTADSLKNLGYQTSAALDITDSFSYLLVTNAASADRANSAINAYSKAIQTGRVDSEGWQSILAAMPTVVDGLTQATGRSTNEIRKLGIEGKLSLAALNESLRQTVDQNGKLADSMDTAVSDAMVTLRNNFGTFVGKVNETSEATGGLVTSIESLAEILGDPKTIESARALASGVVEAFGWIATAAAGTVSAVEGMAEWMAVAAGGIGLHDLERLEAKAIGLQEALNRMESRGETGYAFYGNTKKAFDEITAQLDKAWELAEIADGIGQSAAAAAPKVQQLGGALVGAASSADASAEAGAAADRAAKQQANAYQALYDRLYPAEAAQRKYNEEVEQLKKHLSGDALAKAIDRLNRSFEGADATGPADAIEEYRKELERLEDKINPAGKAAKDFAAEQAKLRAEIQRTGDPTGKWTRLLEENERQMRLNTEGVSVWAQMTEGAVDRVDSAFADMWKNVFDGTGNVLDGMKDAIRQWMAEVVHMLTTKALMTSVGNWLMGTNNPGGIGQVWGSLLGGGGGSGGGSGGMNLGSILQMGQSAYSMITGVGPAALAGWQSGGIGGALNGIGGYYGGLANSAFSTVGGWFGGQGAVQGGAGVMLDAATGNLITAQAANTAATNGLSSVMSSVGGMLTNPVTWIVAGMMASAKAFDAGYQVDSSKMAKAGGSNGVLRGAAWTQAGQSKFFEVLDDGLVDLSGGLVNDKLAAIISGSSFHQMLWEGLLGIFDGSERFERTVGSAKGTFAGGEYGGNGAVESWFGGSKRFGDDFDQSLHGLNEAFSQSLTSLFDMFDIDSEITTETQARLRRTSGKLLASFTASFGDAVVEISGQYAKGARIEAGLEQFFDDVLGRGLAQAIGASTLPAYLKELTSGLTKAEEVGAAISGLFQRFDGANDTIERLNFSAFEMTDAGLRGADALLDLSAAIAGLENPALADKIVALSSLTATYYDQFFTDAEKTADTIDAITRAFASADVELAASREAYRAMVEDIDLTTEAGRQMFAAMMALSGQAAQYFTAVEQQAAIAQQAISGAYSEAVGVAQSAFQRLQSAVGAEVNKLQQQYAAAQARAQSLKQMSDSLSSSLRSMRLESDEFDRMRRTQAQAQLGSALALGRSGGDLRGLDLSDALTELGRANTDLFASFEEYATDYWRTANDINDLNKLTGDQLSIEEQLLAGLDTQFAYYDQMLSDAQAQLNALSGINLGVHGVAAALAGFQSAIGAAQGTPKSNQQAVEAAYQQVLGRSGEAAGVGYWTSRLGDGSLSQAQLMAEMAKWASAADKPMADAYLVKVPGFAAGGMHGGGLRLVGEGGPELEVTGPSRIYNAGQTASMLGGGPELLSEVRALRQENQEMRAYFYQITKNTGDTARGIRQQNAVGIPQQVSA